MIKRILITALALGVLALSSHADNEDCTGSTCSTKKIKVWLEEGQYKFKIVCEGTCPDTRCSPDGSAGCIPRKSGGDEYCRCNTTQRPYGNVDDCLLYVNHLQGGGFNVSCQKKSCPTSCPTDPATGSGTESDPWIHTCGCL